MTYTRVACWRIVACAAIASALTLSARLVAGQQRSGSERTSFDVASIKRSEDSSRGTMLAPRPGGRFEATFASLEVLIDWAYDLQEFQLDGGPDWVRSVHFSVIARAADDVSRPGSNTTPAEMKVMMQSLLAERFGLAVHRESRERPVYALVMARADRRTGPELQPTQVDCANERATGTFTRRQTSSGDSTFACGVMTTTRALHGGNMTMTDLAKWLSSSMGQMVVDRTDLPGQWNVDLAWTPQPRSAADAPAADTADRPSLFTAIQEQLGLRLDARRAPIEFLVIDRADPPTPD